MLSTTLCVSYERFGTSSSLGANLKLPHDLVIRIQLHHCKVRIACSCHHARTIVAYGHGCETISTKRSRFILVIDRREISQNVAKEGGDERLFYSFIVGFGDGTWKGGVKHGYATNHLRQKAKEQQWAFG